jgi:hypothetical protein
LVRLEKRLFLRPGLPFESRRAQILSSNAAHAAAAQLRVSVLDTIEHGGGLLEGQGK